MPHLMVGPREAGNEVFGEILRQFRLQREWTRATAANRLGFTSEYLRLIERGKRTPTFGSMPVIFGVYDVPYSLNGDLFIIEEATIEFTSRIREPRNRDLSPVLLDPNRSMQLAQIIDLLVEADDRTLRAVYGVLRSQ